MSTQAKTAKKIVPNELDMSLQELGLTDSERQLYLLSLSLGPAPVTALADKLGFQRPYVYTLINSLRDHGLAPSSPTKYQKTFVVEPPSVILSALRLKREAISSLSSRLAAELPKLLASYKQGGAATQVLLYEGREKFLELYNRILEEEGNETLYFGDAEHFLARVSEDLPDWIKRRISLGVSIRTLMIDSPLARSIPTSKGALRETRIVPKSLSSSLPASFQLFGRSIIYWQPHTPVAVVLQDEYIVQLMRNVFEILWKQGETI